MSGDPLDLDAIEAHAEGVEYPGFPSQKGDRTVLALVAEVRSLRALESAVDALADEWHVEDVDNLPTGDRVAELRAAVEKVRRLRNLVDEMNAELRDVYEPGDIE